MAFLSRGGVIGNFSLIFFDGTLDVRAYCIRYEALILVWKNLRIFALLIGLFSSIHSILNLAVCHIWHGSLEKFR